MENELLKGLYDCFYAPPERKLVLRIIDAQNLMIEQRSVDSFICGFRLAWEMANELNHYMEERPEPEDDLGPDALA